MCVSLSLLYSFIPSIDFFPSASPSFSSIIPMNIKHIVGFIRNPYDYESGQHTPYLSWFIYFLSSCLQHTAFSHPFEFDVCFYLICHINISVRPNKQNKKGYY